MNFRISLLAAGAALMLAPAVAQAQESVVVSPQFGTPAYTAPGAEAPRNVVGGGVARIVGSGESQQVVHLGPTVAQEPVFAHMVGTGEDARIIYSATPDRNQALTEAGYLPGSRG